MAGASGTIHAYNNDKGTTHGHHHNWTGGGFALVRNFTLKGNTMTVARFTNYICYSTTCPTGITPARWQGMLTWARTNGFL